MQSRLGNNCRHNLQGEFLLRFCTFMIIMSQHFFFSFLPDINWVEKNKTRLCSGCTSTTYCLPTISRKVHLLVFSDLGVVAVEFCWAGLFYTYSSLQFPTSKSQSTELRSLLARWRSSSSVCSKSELVVRSSLRRHLQMTPSKCCYLTNFFDEARHCEGTIVNYLQCALGKMHMSLTQDLMSVVP